jgi:hypothetical protein
MNSLAIGTVVTYTPDPDAALTSDQIAELDALKDRPVDLSDIPESLPNAIWFRLGPGKFLGPLMAEAQDRERAGGPFENIERLLPEMSARVAAMKDYFLDFSDMPDMAPYAITMITGEGPSLKGLMPESPERSLAVA